MTFCKMRFGNTMLELRGALVAGLVIGGVLASIMIGIAIFSPDYQPDRWYFIPIAAVGPAVLLGLVVALTLIDSVHLEGDWVEHRVLDRWIIARHPIVEFERMDSPCGVFAAVIRFDGGHKIRVPGAHLGVLGSLDSELKKRRKELKRQNKPLVASGDNAPV